MRESLAMNRNNGNNELERFFKSFSYSEIYQELASVSEINSAVANERSLALLQNNETQSDSINQDEPRTTEAKTELQTLSNDKRKRTLFTPFQLSRMEEEFRQNMYVVGLKRWRLATELCLTEKQVKIWFQNRRMKLKREQVKTKCLRSGFPWY